MLLLYSAMFFHSHTVIHLKYTVIKPPTCSCFVTTIKPVLLVSLMHVLCCNADPHQLHDTNGLCITHYVRPPQILVPLCGLLLRAVHVEAGVHRGCFHGGGVLWRSGGDHLH